MNVVHNESKNHPQVHFKGFLGQFLVVGWTRTHFKTIVPVIGEWKNIIFNLIFAVSLWTKKNKFLIEKNILPLIFFCLF